MCVCFRPTTTEEQLVQMFAQYGNVLAFKFFEYVDLIIVF